MIEINDLYFGYSKRRELFSGLNLSLKPGNIYGLLGMNGAGKTTLLKQITGLLHPNSGSNTISGINSKTRHPEYLVNFYFVPEEFMLPGVNVKNYIKIYAPFYPNFNEEQFYEYIQEFELPEGHKLSRMSYGQKKKFLLSFGLAANTPVLITDEPTNGLDIPSKSKFRRIMASALNENRMIIISTHQVKDIEGVIDTVVILDNGKVKFNHKLDFVSDKLTFKNIEEGTDNANVLYLESILGGHKAVLKNRGNEFTQPDLELLFNSIISQKSKVLDYLNN